MKKVQRWQVGDEIELELMAKNKKDGCLRDPSNGQIMVERQKFEISSKEHMSKVMEQELEQLYFLLDSSD